MSVHVFAGPSLNASAASSLFPGCWVACPPVRRGDVYRAARAGASAIGIIDGYFGSEPAVSHKEILWALQQGIPVFGCSSIGALRAAELRPFGMIGVGAIFQAYADGLLWRDDEVALLHGPPALDFQPLTLPLVNLRATLGAGIRRGAVEETVARAILGSAERLFFADRTFARLRSGCEAAVDRNLFEAGLNWAEENYVDAKAADAVALCQRLKQPAHGRSDPGFTFHDTEPFAAMRKAIDNPFLRSFE